MNRILLTILLMLATLLVACSSDEPESVVTPPVVAENTAVSTQAPTAPPATATISANAPVSPTPPATDVPPTAVPTATPIPTEPVTSVRLEPLVGDLFRPTYVTHAGDERLFILIQTGLIRIWQDGALLPEPFLDIEDTVNDSANEQGLLGLAFHPNYAENGYFYLNYTNAGGNTVIARYQVQPDDPNLADPNSEVILLTINQPYANHNGGQIAFGPDGYLYVGMGDGGSQADPQGNGQNANTLLGAILRIDVDNGGDAPYAVPAGNPYVSEGNGRGEIWAIGLRNPWRFSFDRLTGDLYIADVGQNQYEEVNFAPANPAGLNYGWVTTEATHCFSPSTNCDTAGFTLPFFEYDHSQGCSVTGGYVYRGQAQPTWGGNYFFSDFCTGFIWSAYQHDDGAWTVNRVLESGQNVASFGEDVNGELYVTSFTGGGQVFRLLP